MARRGDEAALGATLEALPDEVVAALEVRDAWRQRVAASTRGLEFIVSDLSRWPVGSVVRVAFLDGDTALHADVAAATKQVTDAANLTLDFGHDPRTGKYRRWKLTDKVRKAEIQVSFDLGGYWSLVGTDSIDATIDPGGPIGGGPGQRSLNLGGYATAKPSGWKGTVRHEFLHALAFKHEHQNPRGSCSKEFRWDDDPGYVPTTDQRGVFVADAQGRRPGIYTYLAGPPNRWPRSKVDHNLRTTDSPDTAAGSFDPKSVMLYRFAAFFYKSTPSPCAPTGNGLNLSEQDKRGLRLLYPKSSSAVAALSEQARHGLTLLGGGDEGLEGVAVGTAHEASLVDLLTAHAKAGG